MCVCVVKVLVYLTMPIEPDSNKLAEQRSYLQAFKAPLLEGACLGVIVGVVMEPLAAHPDMGEEDAQTVQLVLTLFRNLLRIADPVPTEASGSYHKTRLRVRGIIAEHMQSLTHRRNVYRMCALIPTMRTDVCIYIYMCVCVCIYMCAYIYICVYIYVYKWCMISPGNRKVAWRGAKIIALRALR